MALPSTLYRFQIQLSDVTRGLYETIEMRIAMHPSESTPYLLTRSLAYCLNFQEGIEFTQGVAATDEPAVWVKDLTGTILLWIEVGNPAARRLHKAAKAAKAVRIYTYRDPEILKTELAGQEIYKRDTIELYALEPKFLSGLATAIARDNKWEVLRDEDELSVNAGEKTFTGTITRHAF